jgi:radical SAM protein with 4Fe4S-binding SPASM domain
MDVIWVIPDWYEDSPKPCMDGWGRRSMTVIPDGTVLPCPGAHGLPGMVWDSVRSRPLGDIWRGGADFQRYRGTDWMSPTCASCDRRELDFGGCRCQAFALTGDAARTDPACAKSPDHHLVAPSAGSVRWPPRSPASPSTASTSGAAVAHPEPHMKFRGAKPSLVSSQVRNTAAWALAGPTEDAAHSWRKALVSAEEIPHGHDGDGAYLRLLLAAHHATVATFVPTDFDSHIRFHAWQRCETVADLRVAAAVLEETAAWDPSEVSARVVTVPAWGRSRATTESGWACEPGRWGGRWPWATTPPPTRRPPSSTPRWSATRRPSRRCSERRAGSSSPWRWWPPSPTTWATSPGWWRPGR